MDSSTGALINYEKNLQAIREFPLDKPDAQLKAFSGVLGRTDGGLGIWKPYGYLMGTVLADTVKVIAKTAQISFDQFDALVDAFYEAPTSDLGIHNQIIGQKMKEEKEIIDHIGAIIESYLQKYEKEPTHEGLAELQQLYQACIHTRETQYSAYIGCLKYAKQLKQPTAAPQPASSSASSATTATTSAPQDKTFTNNLRLFCSEHCPHLEFNEAGKLIRQGQALFSEIINGKKVTPHNAATSAQEIAALTWFLMFCAIEKGQGHTNGAFMIEDPQGLLYTYLVKSPGAGFRSSSHLVGRSPDDDAMSTLVFKSAKHQGIDLPGAPLPAEKRTILFEQIDNASFLSDLPRKLLFFKLEDYGTNLTSGYGKDAAMHGVELVHAQWNKAMHPGSDDLPEMRKERIPVSTLKAFNEVVKAVNADPFLKQKLMVRIPELFNMGQAPRLAKLWGIAYMHRFVKELKVEVSPGTPLATAVAQFEADIQEYDYPERRTGREVYFTSDELAARASQQQATWLKE